MKSSDTSSLLMAIGRMPVTPNSTVPRLLLQRTEMQFIKVRLEARKFNKRLIETLHLEPITTFATYNGWALGVDDFVIEIVFRRFRIFDSVHVWHNGAEIWLPLLQRIKLRNTIRLLVTERANDEE